MDLGDDQQLLFQWLSDCETNAQHLSGRCHNDDKLHDEPIYEQCLQLLDLIRNHFSWLVSNVCGQDAVQKWYALGQSVAKVESPRIGPPNQLDTSGKMVPCSQELPGWTFDDEVLVGELISQLGKTRTELMPEQRDEELGQDLFADVPGELADGWLNIEAGIRDLIAELEHDDAPASVPSPATNVQARQNETSPAAPVELRRIIKFANDDRDAWLYQLCCEGLKYSTIASRLREITQDRGWKIISGPSSIRSAANRYAKRHGLPPIPLRQHGRKRTESKQAPLLTPE